MDHPPLEQIWQAILSEAELNMSKANFTTWFKNSFIFDYQNDILTIGVPNAFTQAWFENKFSKDITQIFCKVTGNKLKEIKYVIKTKPKETQNAYNFLAPDPNEQKKR